MTSDVALTPILVLLPGLDGTGKLFAEFLEALDLKTSALVVPYCPDVPSGYDELEPLVRAALPTHEPFGAPGRILFRPPCHSYRGTSAAGACRTHPLRHLRQQPLPQPRLGTAAGSFAALEG